MIGIHIEFKKFSHMSGLETVYEKDEGTIIDKVNIFDSYFKANEDMYVVLLENAAIVIVHPKQITKKL